MIDTKLPIENDGPIRRLRVVYDAPCFDRSKACGEGTWAAGALGETRGFAPLKSADQVPARQGLLISLRPSAARATGNRVNGIANVMLKTTIKIMAEKIVGEMMWVSRSTVRTINSVRPFNVAAIQGRSRPTKFSQKASRPQQFRR